MIEVKVDFAPFREWLRRAGQEAEANARQVLGQAVQLALLRAKATTKFKDRTGKAGLAVGLRASIVRGQHGTWRHFIKAKAPYALYVEGGTKPHEIVARRRNALRFVAAGQLMFRRRVRHPGTKPTHFMDDAATEAARFLDWRMEDAIARAFR